MRDAPVAPPDFRVLFEQAPGLFMVLDPALRIVAATDAYLAATLTRREEIVGRYVFDVFPDNPDEPGADAGRNSLASFQRVLRTGAPDVMVVQRHDVRRPDGTFETRYWSPVNSPVLNPDGSVAYIVHRVENVTDYILQQQAQTAQAQAADELREHTARVEADLYLRSHEVADANLQLKRANEELAHLYAETEAARSAEQEKAMHALQASEARYRTLFTRMTEGFALGEVILDDAGQPVNFRFVEINDAFLRQTGLPRDIINEPITTALPQVEASWIERYTTVAMTGEPIHFVEYNRDTDRYYDVYCYSPEQGKFAILFRDVTAQRRMEEALRESTALLQAISDSAEDVIFAKDREGHLRFANPATLALIGKPLDDVLGRTDLELLDDKDAARAVMANDRQVMESGTPQGLEEMVPLPDGTRRIWYSLKTPYTDEQGRVIGLLGISRDITDRKRAEKALRESEQRYRSFVMATALVVWTTDAHGEVVMDIPSWQAFTGQSTEEARGYGWMNAIHPADRMRVTEAWRRASEAHAVYEVEYLLRTHDGAWRNILARGVPVFNDDGTVREYVGTCIDITDRKRAEEALRDSEARLRTVLETLPVGIMILDTAANLVESNDYVARIFAGEGTLPAPLQVYRQGHAWWAESREPVTADAWPSAQVLRTGAPVPRQEICIQRADGTYGIILDSSVPLRNAAGTIIGVVAMVQDITEQRQAQEALRESEARFSTMANNISQLAWMADKTGAIFWYNQRWYDYTGTTLEEMQGWGWQRVHKPEVLPQVLEKWQRSIATGEPFDMEFPLRGADGHFHPFLTRASPVKDAEGHVVYWFGTNTDITELRAAQQELEEFTATLEERVRARTAQLETANKELEAFSYSVSHDLRAPLRAIDGFSRILLTEYGGRLNPTGHDYLARVRAAAQRMGRLIDDILSLSRIGRREMRPAPVDLSALAAEIITELREAEPNRRAEVYIAPNLMAIGDVGLLRIALENLLGNAWKFTSARDVAHITLDALTQEGKTVYYIRDNGAGFDLAYADKLFTPFQRLHSEEEFPGTGIGLAIVQRIITRHGGRVWAEAKEGEGATFYFTLGEVSDTP